MIELSEFISHLETIDPQDWDKLFRLLPEMETTSDHGHLEFGQTRDDGAFTMPYWVSSEIVGKTLNVIADLNLCPAFDWSAWEEGKDILSNPKFDYAQLDKITLCKLLTTIIRTDRFVEGYVGEKFKSGVMPKIIKALKDKIQKPVDISVSN